MLIQFDIDLKLPHSNGMGLNAQRARRSFRTEITNDQIGEAIWFISLYGPESHCHIRVSTTDSASKEMHTAARRYLNNHPSDPENKHFWSSSALSRSMGRGTEYSDFRGAGLFGATIIDCRLIYNSGAQRMPVQPEFLVGRQPNLAMPANAVHEFSLVACSTFSRAVIGREISILNPSFSFAEKKNPPQED